MKNTILDGYRVLKDTNNETDKFNFNTKSVVC